MEPSSFDLPLLDVVAALAFVGDLSMGQPVDHSLRVAWLASRLSSEVGWSDEDCSVAATVALLRWSGCTANAPEFSEMLGDDVQSRRAMLAETSLPHAMRLADAVGLMAKIHCEVSGDIARTLNLHESVESSLRCIFESHDGTGKPLGLAGERIPPTVFVVCLAGDLEIFARTHGLRNALRHIAERADRRYPASLVRVVHAHAAEWVDALDRGAAEMSLLKRVFPLSRRLTSVELIADVVDLKVPWMAGLSRRVASAALRCSQVLGLTEERQARIYRAGLIHGIGRASVPNSVWESPGLPSEADAERLRLVPYWTHRAARRIDALKTEAELASFVEERLDGSGGFRGAAGEAIGLEARILAVSLRWVWLTTDRPGAVAATSDEAVVRLREECSTGALDHSVVAALVGQAASGERPRSGEAAGAGILTSRELEVLRRIGRGESNKGAARALGISPSTVRAHLENIFRKLQCTTRAAAMLKAFSLGLL